MLTRLSGRVHTVITAVAVLHHIRHFVCLDAVQTLVRFHPLSPAAIEQYIATGEPMDKAGAYAIQGAAAAFVASWEGCYTNVVGLPLRRTAALLHAAGLQVPAALDALDDAMATLQPPNDTASKLFRHQDIEVHHRFEQHRSRAFQGTTERLPSGDLEGQRGALILARDNAVQGYPVVDVR